MNKLIQVEACRCLSVVQDMISTLNQLQFVNSITQGRLQEGIDRIFGQVLAQKYKEACKTRAILDQVIQDQNAVKMGHQKARQNRLEKRREEAVKNFTKEIHDITMIFSQSQEFLDKLKQHFNNYSDLLPNTQVQIGGAGGKSMASGSVADNQTLTHTVGTIHGQQQFAQLKDLIQTLQHMYEVVSQNMNTSVQEEQNKKQLMTQLCNQEQNHRNLVNTYQRDEKQMLNNNKMQETQIKDQLNTINSLLQQNANNGEQTMQQLYEQTSNNEIANQEQFQNKNKHIAAEMQEKQRQLTDIIKKSLDQIKDYQKQKKQHLTTIKESIKQIDTECDKLDQEKYRLMYQINISNARISVLDVEIKAYNEDKAIRDAKQKEEDAKLDRHQQEWDLSDMIAILREK